MLFFDIHPWSDEQVIMIGSCVYIAIVLIREHTVMSITGINTFGDRYVLYVITASVQLTVSEM